MRRVIPALALLIVIAAVLLLAATPATNQNGRVCIKDACFSVNVSVTSQQIERGLMFVSNISNDSGMLFVLPREDIWPFWMKNVEIPLDIIWIDNGSIVFMAKNSMPCGPTCPLITPDKPAKFVLEVDGGTADRLGFAVGDAAETTYTRLQK